MTQSLCPIHGCENPVCAKGWCDKHYRRMLKHGTMDLKRIVGDDLRRFLNEVTIGDGCWEWTAGRTTAGYGKMAHKGRQGYAHRFAYETFIGPIPLKYDLDHLCRNRGCCNPSHLEAVTHRENVRRGIKGILTTHCPQGHEYNEVNSVITSRGWRRCKVCRYKSAGATVLL